MARFVFFGAVLALVLLIIVWNDDTLGAKVAKGASIAYLVIAVVLLIVGLTIHWE